MRLARSLAMALAAIAASSPAAAQDAEAQFYRDKTVTVVIGTSAGGGVDTYGRLLARHIGKHIPGNPRVVPANMPGAGTLVATVHIYSAAARDGTQIGAVLAGAILDPLLGTGARKFEPTQFNYVGNANLETQVCVVRTDAPVKSFEDVFKTEMVVGATGPGSAILLYPLFLKNFFGAKIKLVSGYPGSREVSLALQKGEVHATCGLNWSSAKVQFPGLASGAEFKVLVQEDVAPNAELAKMGVPLTARFVKGDEDRRVLEVFYAQSKINRVFIAPPEVPPQRVAALRKAFMATIADPELKAEADKMQLDLDATPGEEIQALVSRLYATPPAIVERMRAAITGGN